LPDDNDKYATLAGVFDLAVAFMTCAYLLWRLWSAEVNHHHRIAHQTLKEREIAVFP
jgi:hypothetical protein